MSKIYLALVHIILAYNLIHHWSGGTDKKMWLLPLIINNTHMYIITMILFCHNLQKCHNAIYSQSTIKHL